MLHVAAASSDKEDLFLISAGYQANGLRMSKVALNAKTEMYLQKLSPLGR
jgi:hypothetical protein